DHNADAKAPDFQVENLGVSLKRMLRGDIEALVRRRHKPKDRADIDDPPGPPFAHVRQGALYHADRPPEIGFELTARFLQARLFDRAGQSEACIVDQNVDTSGTAQELIDQSMHALVGADIELQHLDAL